MERRAAPQGILPRLESILGHSSTPPRVLSLKGRPRFPEKPIVTLC
jgi:hypothetical protein